MGAAVRLVGWSTRTTAGSCGVFRCPGCRTMEPYEHVRARRWLTVGGARIAPAGPSAGAVTCTRCRSGFSDAVLEWRRTTVVERAEASPRVPAA